LISANGSISTATLLDQSKAETTHSFPSFLPDGNHFIFWAQSTNPQNTGIYAGSLDEMPSKLIVRSKYMAQFAAPHHLIYVIDSTLVAQEFDLEKLELKGEPVTLAQSLSINPINGVASFAVSENQVLAYRPMSVNFNVSREMTIADRQGVIGPTVGIAADYRNPALSPREDLIAVQQEGDIWIIDRNLGPQSKSKFTYDRPQLAGCSKEVKLTLTGFVQEILGGHRPPLQLGSQL
jgi:eukaryotic-like serine/threonine-protein kinase